jgi:hypothetical protein
LTFTAIHALAGSIRGHPFYTGFKKPADFWLLPSPLAEYSMLEEALGRHLVQPCSRLDVHVDANGACRSITYQGREYLSRTLSWRQLFDADSGSLPADYLNGAKAGTVDAICIQTLPLADVNPLSLVHFARRLLRHEGLLVCVVQPRRRRPASADLIENFCSIALRCGFQCVEQTALSARDPYAETVLVLRQQASPLPWQLRLFCSADVAEFFHLFKKSFGSDYDRALWTWKYAAGRGRAVAVWREDELVGHFGSTQRSLAYLGRQGSALQVCDVMVAPRQRGVLVKQGAMFVAAATFFELYLGVRSHMLAYGFPTHRHMLLGEKLGLYREVAKMMEVRWDVSDVRHHRVRAFPIEPGRWSACVRRAWSAMRASLRHAVCTVRDPNYLEYRYVRHPLKQYRIICVQTPLVRSVIGILILRKEDADCELVDVIGPLRNIPLLVSEARYQAFLWGCSKMHCWITSCFSSYFLHGGGVMTDLGASVAMSIWVPGSLPAPQTDNWWMMSGDTEFR